MLLTPQSQSMRTKSLSGSIQTMIMHSDIPAEIMPHISWVLHNSRDGVPGYPDRGVSGGYGGSVLYTRSWKCDILAKLCVERMGFPSPWNYNKRVSIFANIIPQQMCCRHIKFFFRQSAWPYIWVSNAHIYGWLYELDVLLQPPHHDFMNLSSCTRSLTAVWFVRITSTTISSKLHVRGGR
jgi:hypothetical protein